MDAKYEYVLMSNYGYGWNEELTEETYSEIQQRLKEYQENTNGIFKIKKRKVEE